MHRMILGLKHGDKREGDHKDHNGLNNQRSNLRIATRLQNGINKRSRLGSTSKYVGVSLGKTKNKKLNKVYLYWVAEIKVNGKRMFIGNYKTEEDAARARDVFAKKYHGEFANLNFK